MNDNTELLEAALKLAAITKRAQSGEGFLAFEMVEAIAEVEKFRPAPKLVELWARLSPKGTFLNAFETKDAAEMCPFDVRVIHVREVTPPDESKRWWHDGAWIMLGGDVLCECINEHQARAAVAAHNEAMGFGKEASHE